jgi:uncharacterized BrkB/YihY/UPF0761 family membrane protein
MNYNRCKINEYEIFKNDYEEWKKSTFRSKRHYFKKFLFDIIDFFISFLTMVSLMILAVFLGVLISIFKIHPFLQILFVFFIVLLVSLLYLYLFKNKRKIIFKKLYLSLIRK